MIERKMMCDTRRAHGDVKFYDEYFEWESRFHANIENIKIYFKDITSVNGRDGHWNGRYGNTKGRVTVETTKGTYEFLVHHVGTFVQWIFDGREFVKQVEESINKFNDTSVTLTREELDKFEKLVELHKDGVIDDESFAREKSLILNKK